MAGAPMQDDKKIGKELAPFPYLVRMIDDGNAPQLRRARQGSGESRPRFFDDRRKRVLVMHGQIRQYAAIQANLGLAQPGDQAAAEPCPVWPGQPMTAHWGIRDPAAVTGTEETKRKAFLTAYTELHRRISLFVNLPIDKLSDLALKQKLDEIGLMQ